MSITNELGSNISLAVEVLRETYKNLNLLFSEMDMIGKDLGFVPLTARFLRWKSDSYEDGWLLTNFIKIYQLDGASASNEHVPDLKEGAVYVVEIELAGDDGYPEITLSRFHYDLSRWERMPAISDHWLFNHPYRIENHFDIECVDDIWRSNVKEKSSKKYWGFKKAIGKTNPLVTVNDAESIRVGIFQQLLDLP
ncbi:hypothetical protein [Paenibacillus odorifer]|uniref:hypothetical protein n=1 Tax=Paenibacillus odorifer TaxID=189426 RepID=UPI00096E1203|nr:hypothetical protein [Paenibacillus odorifer]OMD93547.1 hypothetical protein BSK67_16645 [Paenibacillus odorifer]